MRRPITAASREVNLAQTTLLLTRPRDAALRFAAMVQAETGPFAAVVVSPLIEIVPLVADLRDGPDSGFLFTSEQGAQAAAALSPPAHRRAFCVGDRTAQTAQALGYAAQSAQGSVEDLLAQVVATAPPGALIHASGQHSRGDLAARLCDAGLRARRVAVYDQRAQPLSAEASGVLRGVNSVIAPVFSPRSARLFSEAAQGARAPLILVAISTAAAAPLGALGPASVTVAATPDAQGMCAAVIRLAVKSGIA